MNRTKHVIAKMRVYSFLYYFTWSVTFILYTLWLSEVIGLNSVSIGTVFAVNGVFAVCAKPVYGYILDRSGMSKNILYFIGLISVAMAPFFIYIYKPLLINYTPIGIVAGSIFLSLGWYAGVAANESYMDRISRLYGTEFGRIRMLGSIGSTVGASVSGILFNISPNINLVVSSATAAIMLLILLSIKIDETIIERTTVISTEKIKPRDIATLLQERKFWMFALYVAGVVWVMFVAEQQFPRFFVTFFKTKELGNEWYGYMMTVKNGIEFFSMLTAPIIVNRLGAKNALILCGILIGFRLILCGLVHNYIAISILKTLYGMEMALLLVSVFKYIADNFHAKFNATMYLLGYQTMVYVGSTIISAPVGHFYDAYGFEQTYFFMGIFALTFTIISYFTLSGKSYDEAERKHKPHQFNKTPIDVKAK
ncbi:oligosaccharide MFS transporter [Scandinavium sp. H11S7]|uniref:Oligosaccharide MFS transporter n=1 Tax=Scandinavium hiltneri TaxID=2926519 RepID=A0ABT2E161_9ENTR|nr:oligosaccharide MFS transporter [Scandinavium hiltneri]MCS2161555.1 oligosaccharide MFS transporter [Scandinavium hiltneri]